jgi:ribosome-associated translation inhibitor RaiA
MNELDFTIEFNSEDLYKTVEEALFLEADGRLRYLADGHSDLRGSAVNIRHPGPALYEATVVVYGRPDPLSATEKNNDPTTALKCALSAIERQVRQRRDKLQKTWEQPGNDPVTQEVMEVMLAENQPEEGRTEKREGKL